MRALIPTYSRDSNYEKLLKYHCMTKTMINALKAMRDKEYACEMLKENNLSDSDRDVFAFFADQEPVLSRGKYRIDSKTIHEEFKKFNGDLQKHYSSNEGNALSVTIERMSASEGSRAGYLDQYSDEFLNLCQHCPFGLMNCCESKIHTIEKYRYFRITKVEGEIGVYPQNTFIKRKSLPRRMYKNISIFNTHYGHLVAESFGGPACPFNLITMTSSTNVGPYLDLETRVRESLGKEKIDYDDELAKSRIRTNNKYDRMKKIHAKMLDLLEEKKLKLATGKIEITIHYDPASHYFSIPTGFHVKIDVNIDGTAGNTYSDVAYIANSSLIFTAAEAKGSGLENEIINSAKKEVDELHHHWKYGSSLT